MAILCTICARGGSKGVLKKNIKVLAGKPLIGYSIQQAADSCLFDKIVVSTDDIEIASISKDYGASFCFIRSEELATDECGKLLVIKNALLTSEQEFDQVFETVVDLDVTSPLRSVDDIKQAYNLFFNCSYDNLITAAPARRSPYFNLIELSDDNKVGLSKQPKSSVLRRQDSPKCYDMNASIYIWKRNILLNNNSLFLENTGLYVMPYERSIDIDCEIDFQFVEFLMKLRNRNV